MALILIMSSEYLQNYSKSNIGAEINNFNFSCVWVGMKNNYDTSNIQIDMPEFGIRVLQDKKTWRYNTSLIPLAIAMGTHFSGDGKSIDMKYDIITFFPLFANNGSIRYKLNDYLSLGYKSEFDPFWFSTKIEPYWSSGIIQKIKYRKITFELVEKWQWINSYDENRGFKFETGISWLIN